MFAFAKIGPSSVFLMYQLHINLSSTGSCEACAAAAQEYTLQHFIHHMHMLERPSLTWRGAATWPCCAATLLRGTMSPAAADLDMPFSSGTTLSPSSDEAPLSESILHRTQCFCHYCNAADLQLIAGEGIECTLMDIV
jgi:hypothetical protein